MAPVPNDLGRLLQVAVALMALAACGPEPEDGATPSSVSAADAAAAAALVATAETLVRTGEYEEAREIYLEALAKDPTNAVALRHRDLPEVSPALREQASSSLGQAVNRMIAGDPPRARAILIDARALDPWNREIRSNLARVDLILRRFDEAMRLFDEQIACDPSDAMARLGGAEAAWRARDSQRCLDYLEGMEIIEAAARTDPALRDKMAEAWYLRGVAAQEMNRPALALEYLERASALAPDTPKMIHRIAGIHMVEGRFERAVELFLRVLELDPEHADAPINLGRTYERSGDTEAAILWFGRGLRKRPEDWESMISLARCHEAMGERQHLLRALSHLERAVEIQPQSHEAYFTLAKVHRRLGNRELADRYQQVFANIKALVAETESRIEKTHKRLLRNPKDVEARLEAIAIHREFHQVAVVKEEVAKLLLEFPRHPDGLYEMSLLLRVEGDLDGSYYEGLKLMEAAPDDPRGYRMAAWALRDRGDWRPALELARRAFDLDATDFGALETMLASMQQLGGHEDEMRRLVPLYAKMREAEERRRMERRAREDERNREFLAPLGDG